MLVVKDFFKMVDLEERYLLIVFIIVILVNKMREDNIEIVEIRVLWSITILLSRGNIMVKKL